MSTAPSSRSSSPSSNDLSDLDRLMASSPPRFEDDDEELPERVGAPEDLANSEDRVSGQQQGSQVLSTAPSLRAELAQARRRGERAKLHPYQREALDTFVQSTPLAREVELFILLCSVFNHVGNIVVATPKYTVPDALRENIKTYVYAILLSEKLSAYKKDGVPLELVYKALMKDRVHMPENVERDAHSRSAIKTAITAELTQYRSKVKKMLKASFAEKDADSQTIYDLTSGLIDGTSLTISVPLCARVALLRKLFTADSKYWDNVDKFLLGVREKANGDKVKSARTFERILNEDRDKYGDRASYTIPDIPADMYQSTIDQVIH